MSITRPLILASGSPYRKELLARLGIRFTVRPADIDETPAPGEPARTLVMRLALEKALAVAADAPDALVLGLDQVAACEGDILGKPGTGSAALDQLRKLRGREVIFHSGVCLVRPEHEPVSRRVDTFVRFRELEDAELIRYVQRDRPMDCAGSFRSESMGSTLVHSMTSDDPTALIGMPLIAVSGMLREAGWELP